MFEVGRRSIDGSGNNLADPEMGAALAHLARLVLPAYGDGVSQPAGADRPNPRAISNAVCAREESVVNRLGATDYLWQWGQFVDHDLDLTDGVDPPEAANISIPSGDFYFDPDGTGEAVFRVNRSIYDRETGTDVDNPRQQLNEITAWIDASNVYGCDAERALALRTNDGTGRLKTSDGDLLPWNDEGLENAGGSSAALFLAGDVRANEQVGLTSLHTLFVREHNRLADELRSENVVLTGDQIYHRVRQIVGAQLQVITYREYLPALLGPEALSQYQGYDPEVDARITNLFATAAYRYGHSALSPFLLRLDMDGAEIPEGHLALRDAFFSPLRIVDEGGIEPILRGLAAQECQAVDLYVVDDVRNFLFGAPGSGGFDLASLNIQRGRDHGLPSYNDVRRGLGLAPRVRFADVTADRETQERLASVYPDVESIDACAEDPLPGGHVGELIFVVLSEQFEALRDGDRFWYSRTLDPNTRRAVEETRLVDIIRRNTTIGDEIQDDVFHVVGGDSDFGDRLPNSLQGAGRRFEAR